MANSPITLEQLLQSIHGAVIKAQDITEKQHMRQLEYYFNWYQKNSDELADITKNAPQGAVDDEKDEYYNDNKFYGRARTWTIKVPNMHPDAGRKDSNGNLVNPDEPVELPVKVPLMALIPPSAIKIDSMTVDFKISLNDVFEYPSPKDRKARPMSGLKDEDGAIQINLGQAGDSHDVIADVRIEFRAGEPAESFLRINDHLIKSIV